MKTYIGIDPGECGFITVMRPDGSREYFSIKDHDRVAVASFIRSFSGSDAVCAMENVHALFGASAKSTFNFGEIYGFLQGVIMSAGIPYHLIQPKLWQKEIWEFVDIVEKPTNRVNKAGQKIKAVDTKATSINAARRMFPAEHLGRTERCTSIDDNKVDSLLIAEYARRKNL